MKLQSSSLKTVSDTVDFICRLVFKDEVLGDSLETQESIESAAAYLSAYLKTDNKTDLERALIIEAYVELNPYYKELYTKHGIYPYTSRLAKDLDIIYQPTEVFTEKPYLNLYRSIYKESLQAFYVTSYSKAFEAKKNYREFCKLSINLMAFLNLMHKWLENPFDIDIMDEDQIDRFVTSFGIPYFTSLPLAYKRKVAKNLNRLITKKGTDQVIVDILDIFDFSNIDIYKYYLAKSTTNAEVGEPGNDWLTNTDRSLKFLSHNIRVPSLNTAIRNNAYRKTSFPIITELDEHWQATEAEIQRINFDYVQTKYFSIETGFEVAKETINTVFILNMIKRIRSDYNSKESMRLNVRSISTEPIDLEDIIIALQILTNDYQGIVDMIQYDVEGIAGVYEFAKKDSAALNAALFNTSDLNIKNAVTLTDMDSVSTFNQANLLAAYNHNITVHTNIKESMKRETKYSRYKKLKELYNYKFIQKLNYSLFNGEATYTDYIQKRNTDLYNMIVNLRAETDQSAMRVAIEKRIIELIDIVKEFLNGFELFLGSTSIGILSSYLRQVIITFKSFTVSMRDLDVFIIIKEDTQQRIMDEMKFGVSMLFKTDTFIIRDRKIRFKSSLRFRDKRRILDRLKSTSKITFKDKNVKLKLRDKIKAIRSDFKVKSKLTKLRDRQKFKGSMWLKSFESEHVNDFFRKDATYRLHEHTHIHERLAFLKPFDYFSYIHTNCVLKNISKLTLKERRFFADRLVIRRIP